MNHRVQAARTFPFSLPPLDLLGAVQPPPAADPRVSARMAARLEALLRELGIGGQVVDTAPGPVVTTFTFHPDNSDVLCRLTNPGTADDLLLMLPSDSVRVTTAPTGAAVLIELPNRERGEVPLRGLLESEPYQLETAQTALALGRTPRGEPFLVDLARTGHLLVAGAAMTGKSTALRSMVATLLFRTVPETLRLVLIDPTILELSVFDGIPHLQRPPVVDPATGVTALREVTALAGDRDRHLMEMGAHDIWEYNARAAMHRAIEPRAAAGLVVGRLPRVVVVIDDLEPLMRHDRRAVEESILTLAQLGRTTGVHVIAATGSTSTDILTTMVQASLSARMTFLQPSAADSRAILDQRGAEHLLRLGDLLYLPPATARPVRLHGPYIGEVELARLAGFLRRQRAA